MCIDDFKEICMGISNHLSQIVAKCVLIISHSLSPSSRPLYLYSPSSLPLPPSSSFRLPSLVLSTSSLSLFSLLPSFFPLPPHLSHSSLLFSSPAPSLSLSVRAVRLQFLLQFYQFQHIHHINSNGIFENIKQMAMLKTNDLIKSNIYKIKTEIDL